MNKDMIDTLIEIDKQMKAAQEPVANYIIKQTEENTWVVIDENGEVINTITKDTIVNYCNNEFEKNRIEYMSADLIIDIWWNVDDDYNLEFVDSDCQDWEKFSAWFDYTCVECLAQKLIAFYKQRLLNFE